MFSSRSWQCKMPGLWGTNGLSAAKVTAPPHELKCTRVQGALLNLRQKTDVHLHLSFLHWWRTKPGKAHIMRSTPCRSEHPATVLPADQSLKVKTMLRPSSSRQAKPSTWRHSPQPMLSSSRKVPGMLWSCKAKESPLWALAVTVISSGKSRTVVPLFADSGLTG